MTVEDKYGRKVKYKDKDLSVKIISENNTFYNDTNKTNNTNTNNNNNENKNIKNSIDIDTTDDLSKRFLINKFYFILIVLYFI